VFWFIVIGLIILAIIGASSTSGKEKAASTITAMAQMVGTEKRFREYWRFLHKEMTKTELSSEKEQQIVEKHLSSYLELIEQMKAVTPENVQVIAPALAKQGEIKDMQIASEISPQFARVMSSKWKRDRAYKKYGKDVLGISF
jgi:Asp-tRNA(Asn)/Glu-tRNA(Gln) amidotransferase C subunit